MRRLFISMVLALFLAVSVAGQDDQTVVIRGFGNIVTFNPALTSDGASYQASSLLFPAPVEVDPFTGETVEGLTSWEVSEDGLTYTFTIRDGAVWSDGTPITSADMAFSIGAGKDDELGTVWTSNVELVDSVNIIDDSTYEVILSDTNCAALSDLGSIRFLPAHKYAADYSDFVDSDFNMNPDISGGPYILEEWSPDEFQRFRANPDFWAGEPNIPFLINRVIGEQAVAIQAIQAGEIDYTYFQGDLFEQIANKDDLQFASFPQVTVNFLSLNWADPNSPEAALDEDGNVVEQTPHPLFSDINVRKAVAMGYNKQDILATLGGEEGGTPLLGVVAPTIGWAYNNEVELYPYDPDMAMQLLDEAGWTDADGDGVRECNGCATAEEGTPLAFTIRYSNILQLFETTVLVVQDQLGQIGFDVSLELVEWSNYIPEVYFGQMYDATAMSNSGGTQPPDPNDFTTLLLASQDIPGSGNNLASYVNPEVDELIRQARSVPGCDQQQRAELYYQIQQIAHDDVAYDFTFTPNIYQVANNRIQGFNPGPSWVFYGYTAHVHEWSLGE
ncbi:MAG: ABC transporter substrate-binding protein [Anaerolineaceae bacterium]|nr:ABC transporter substrate-binding protein [Anaerolineae bacterium]MCB9459704.1 ABC transporter substrate-binding protein [Anaerolineaceae bacterium]